MGIAESAVLSNFNLFGVFLFILGGCIIALLTFVAGHGDTDSHALTPPSWYTKILEYSITTGAECQ
jgi:hypothetical protein